MRPLRQLLWPPLPSDAHTLTNSNDHDEELPHLLLWQDHLLDATIDHPRCRLYPPSQHYTLRFLKDLMRKLDALRLEVSERLLTAYVELLETLPKRPEEGGPPLPPCYRTYWLDADCDPLLGAHSAALRKFPLPPVISLKESQLSISGGTTGLCTWKAALRLSEYILANPALVHSRRVLELGSGMGLVGLVSAYAGASFVTLTDVHPDVLDRLKENVCINGFDDMEGSLTTEKSTKSSTSPTNTEQEEAHSRLRGPSVKVTSLDWFNCSDSELSSINAHVIMAADVVYDPDIVEALSDVISRALIRDPVTIGLVASTVRNRDTHEKFLACLEKRDVRVCEVRDAPPVSRFFESEEQSEVVLLRLEAGLSRMDDL